MFWTYCTIFTISLVTVCMAQSNSTTNKPALLRLSNDLMKEYNKGVRPVKDWRTATNVTIDIFLYTITGVDEKHQILATYIWTNLSWVDEYLSWDPLEYDNLTRITVPTSWIWIPDIMVVEYVDSGKEQKYSYLYMDNSGRVYYDLAMEMKTFCRVDVYYFPFDHQNCSITFISWIHTQQEINIALHKNKTQRTYSAADDGEWSIVNLIQDFSVLSGQDGSDYVVARFYVVFKRSPLFYTVNLILPSTFLLLMDVAGFYLPPESGERVPFKITLILGYSVFLIIVSDKLPAAGTPLIGIYFLMCMVMLVLSLIGTIFIVGLYNQHNLNKEVPMWLKKLTMQRIAPLLCLRNWTPFTKPMEESPSEQSESRTEIQEDCQSNDHNKLQVKKQELELLLDILKEISSIKEHLKNVDHDRIVLEWLHVAHIFDTLFFRAYLIALFLYAISLLSVWVH